MAESSQFVQKLGNHCDIMQDDRICYGVNEVQQRLSVVEELQALISANLQRGSRLRQSILQNTFSGTLCLQTLET